MAETITIAGKKYPKAVVYGGGFAIVGIVGYAWWTRGRGEDVVEDTYGEDVYGIEEDTITGSGTTQSGFIDVSPDKYETDQEWFNDALDKLLFDYGLSDTGAAADALNKYLNQQTMSAEEAKWISFVINSIGPPPTGARQIRTGSTGPADTSLLAPTGLKAVKNSNNSVTLSWNAVSGASSYQVKRASGPSSPATASSTGTSYTTPILSAALYTYEIRARNSAGSYGPPSSVSVTITTSSSGGGSGGGGTSSGKPKSLVGLRWANITPTSMTISWNKVTNATSYVVTHEILSSPGKGTKGSTTVTGTSFTSSGLNPNSKHKFTVAGRNSVGRGTPSTIIGTTRRS